MNRAVIDRNNRWLVRVTLIALGYCFVYAIAQVIT